MELQLVTDAIFLLVLLLVLLVLVAIRILPNFVPTPRGLQVLPYLESFFGKNSVVPISTTSTS